MGKGRNHLHKYHKVDMPWGRVWACALPNCSHYMPQHMEAMVNGKYSICWGCGEKFILDPMNMKMDMPICRDCEPKQDLPPELAEMFKE